MGFTIESKETCETTGMPYTNMYATLRGMNNGYRKVPLNADETVQKYRISGVARFYADKDKAEMRALRKHLHVDITEEQLNTNPFDHLYAEMKSWFAITVDE